MSINKIPTSSMSLTQNQYLMWMGQRFDPDLPLYNMALTFIISGKIDKKTFTKAFQMLVEQTDAMRLVFSVEDEIPRQSVLDSMDRPIKFLDFSAESKPIKAMEQWQAERVKQPFDLTQCLFDSVLLKLTDTEFAWYLNQHHLITDGWSSTVVYKRMSRIYQNLKSGRYQPHTRYPCFADYIDYEQQFRQSTLFKRIQQHWQDKLVQPHQPTRFFATSSERNSAQTQRFSYSISPAQITALNALLITPKVRAINEDITKFSIFASVLFFLMHRLGGEQYLTETHTVMPSTYRLGTPFHNRPTDDFKKTAGLFIEVGVLQIDVDDTRETFISLIKQVQAEVLTGLRYAQAGASSATINSSYDVLLNYIHADYGDFAGAPMHSQWVHSGSGDRHHCLRLQVHDHDKTGGFTLHFDLNTDAFDPKQSQWLIQHFKQGMNAILKKPQQRLKDINLLSSSQWQRRIIDYNSTHVDYPQHDSVLSLFDDQVRQTPQAIALEMNAQKITYKTLEYRANQLASTLRNLDVETGGTGLVGLLLERSIEAVIAVFASFKAGLAYVPIDAITPPERIAYILKDAGIGIVLTEQALYSHINSTTDTTLKVLCIDYDPNEKNTLVSTHAPHSPPKPDDLAYVIYTSGSTGKPKGVKIPHRGLLHYIQWAKRFYLKGQRLNFPLYSSLAFDLTVTSIFTPLVSGGTLIIYPEEFTSSSVSKGLEILTVIKDNRVDIIKLTPAHLALFKTLSLEKSRIRQIIVGGEAFKTRLAKDVHQRFKSQNQHITLYNEYGPTETVVGCMIHQYDADKDQLATVPIGRPIHNTQIYVLDKHLNPTATGVIGELCIAGSGVGRGYVNQPKLTNRVFVDNPFSPGERLYRSGDQARWIENSNTVQGGSSEQIELLGRIDHQVKINGYRIELDEIEKVLLQHPALQEVVVDAVTEVRKTASSASTTKPSPEWPAHIHYCKKCGLPSNYPNTTFDDQGVCNTCRDFEVYRSEVESYFRTRDDLQILLDQAKTTKTGKYDCLVLLSGGKDSTYMLCQVVEAGITPLVFSLDNGYISESAKDNVKRITTSLGLDHIWGSTPHMNTIFKDSLKRFSNVCQGCFKTIYTLSYNLAKEQGINTIITGLSRGQLFETRLSDTFNRPLFDSQQIDQVILDARKVYHRMDDAVSQCLDTKIFDTDDIFNEIQFLDFYRYTDVKFEEMYTYLTQKTPWKRPKDTGRSTNCLINDLGIYVHKKEQGYHNYALPYSWDVRIGHKIRAEALHELDDDIDESRIQQILAEVGYTNPAIHTNNPFDNEAPSEYKKLVAYYVSSSQPDPAQLITFLRKKIPEYMLPKQFIRLDHIPLTASGKVNRTLLSKTALNLNHTNAESNYVHPKTVEEIKLAQIWADVMHLKQVGLNDNFFDLGGDSISGIQIIAEAKQQGLVLLPKHIFEYQTVKQLAQVVKYSAQRKEPDKESTLINPINQNRSEFPLADLDDDSLNDLADVLNQLGENT